MDRKIAGLLGAATALATIAGVQAAAASPAQTQSAPATSYRDLLDPVPDALSQLKADDARLAEQSSAATRVAQVSVQIGHHHHHHHHLRVRVLPRHPRHHHHHHHHHHMD